MKRLLPAPLLSIALFVLWLLLTDSASAGHLIIALVLALTVPFLSASLRPQRGRVSQPGLLLRLVVNVGSDVIVSVLKVACGVLQAPWHAPRSTFVRVPLDLRDAHALAALAIITTVVPGTVWTELAPDRSNVLVHVWDLDDATGFIARYKQRYERPLREIFE